MLEGQTDIAPLPRCVGRRDIERAYGLKPAVFSRLVANGVQLRPFSQSVMEACLEAGVQYVDLGGLFHTTQKQLKLHNRFAEKGITAVLGMGSAPGIPNIQSRYAADRLDTIEYVRIYAGIKPPAPDDMRFTYAVPTILDEMTLEPMVYRDGKFVAEKPQTGFEDYWFTQPIGLLPMHYSLHSEVATIPITFKEKGVKECFFKISNFPFLFIYV